MDFDHSSGYSPRACKRCKLLKRKCDKAVPKCHSCTKSHFKCIYQELPEGCSKYETTPSATPPTAIFNTTLRSSASGCNNAFSEFPPIYFLDFQLYQRTVTEIPRITTVIRPELQALTEDIREQAKVYFRTVHPWIPFLSKKSFNERLLSPFTSRGTDLILLFACVKLVCSRLEGENGRTTAYMTIKSALLEAEVAGVFTIRVLQAWILICIYEIGHAIYPSAYLSIGICAKYAAALGVNRDDTDAPGQTIHWIEAEERTRAWWAIVILDRYLSHPQLMASSPQPTPTPKRTSLLNIMDRFSNLGCPSPSLSTEDPRNDTRLPIDDTSWDKAILKHGHVATLSTPPTPLMGRYGLTAQAASLLGQVLHHLYDTKSVEPFCSEEAGILDRALAALTAVANEEGSSRGIGVCTPTAICHSARILLVLRKKSHEALVEHLHRDQENKIIQCGIASDMIRLCQWSTSEQGHQVDDEISPFPLNAAYHTAAAYLEMYNKTREEEYILGVWQVKALLTMYNQRWKLAGVYLKLIEAREAIYMSGLS